MQGSTASFIERWCDFFMNISRLVNVDDRTSSNACRGVRPVAVPDSRELPVLEDPISAEPRLFKRKVSTSPVVQASIPTDAPVVTDV